MFYAADHVKLIDPRPAPINPFAGDVHPEGNPHLHTDPQRLLIVAERWRGSQGRCRPAGGGHQRASPPSRPAGCSRWPTGSAAPRR
jgi:hypothetical protein